MAILAAGLVAVSGYAAWRITKLNGEKASIDAHIGQIESQLQQATNSGEADRLITQLDSFEGEGEELQRGVFYRIEYHERDLVTAEIRRLLAEFGAERYHVPPEFSDSVRHFVQQYEGADRPLMARALGGAANQIAIIRRVIEQEHLPPDLAYLPLVESALGPAHSTAGAAGPWQLTAATARALGLRVGDGIDERASTVKSTHAACRYLRELILDFGTGSSVMLALAAYNSGPTKVKQAVQRTVNDPIKQRSFWYLYHVHALPEETRQYVPKVIAAIIIGRNPGHFGFGDESNRGAAQGQ